MGLAECLRLTGLGGKGASDLWKQYWGLQQRFFKRVRVRRGHVDHLIIKNFPYLSPTLSSFSYELYFKTICLQLPYNFPFARSLDLRHYFQYFFIMPKKVHTLIYKAQILRTCPTKYIHSRLPHPPPPRLMCMSLKLPVCLREAKVALAAGHSVVIGLQSTGEPALNPFFFHPPL